MRRINAITTILIMGLFLLHMIWGGLELSGMLKGGSGSFRTLSYLLVILIGVHVCISAKLTMDTIRATKRSGVCYWRENRLFFLRRASGFALLLFIVLHVLIFNGVNSGGVYRLRLFDLPALVSQLLMVLSLLLHLLTNINPLKIALGFSDRGNVKTDIALVLAALLVLAGIAFFVYFLRWQLF